MSKGGCCSFHYCGWREELNEGIDKRLKKKKKGKAKRKKENWKVMGGGEENLFYHFFYITGAIEKKRK